MAKIMSVQNIKRKHPDVFREIYNRGIKAEKRRVWKIKREEWIRQVVREINSGDLF